MKHLLIGLLVFAGMRTRGWGDQTIFADGWENGWEDWSWAETSIRSTPPLHGGSGAIQVTAEAWEALYLHHAAQDPSGWLSVRLWLNGGNAGGQRLQLQALIAGKPLIATNLPALPANAWKEFVVPLANLGITNQSGFDGFYLQDRTGTTQPAFFVDDIGLVSRTITPPVTNGAVSVKVDGNAEMHSIDPRIYGVAYASTEQVRQLNVTLNRQGGNNTSRYNWQLNADNRAGDYFFLSIPYDSAGPGEHGDTFMADTRAGGAEPSLTIPMLDWVAKVGPKREWLWSYSIGKYGPQRAHEPFRSDCGDGVRPNGEQILGNDPSDANVAAGPAFQQGWLDHLVGRWGRAGEGGLQYYHLDNEPGIWHESHRDVHPEGATMNEVRDKMISYATRIKETDPGAWVLGPEEWHFYGTLFSGADMQYEAEHGYPGVYPDRASRGGVDVYPYLLRELAAASAKAGQRLLDVCTVHYYPQGGEFGDDTSRAIQLLRNRSTRSLWDPAYVDESWLADNSLTRIVRLIPRLKQWVNANYPGTRIGITEYNWGAEGHINGATAQADILGIFGREGLDVAERWTTPATGSPAFKAIQMYRNYDGQGSAFGDVAVRVETSLNPDVLAAFAARRSVDSAMTVMLVHKALDASTPLTLTLTNQASEAAQVWQLTASQGISRLGDVSVNQGLVNVTLPAQSVTLLVIADQKPRLEIQPGLLRLTGVVGQSYDIEGSSDLATWEKLSGHTLAARTQEVPVAMSQDPHRFYRAVWRP